MTTSVPNTMYPNSTGMLNPYAAAGNGGFVPQAGIGAPAGASASGFDWGGLLGNLFGSIGQNAGNIGGGIAGNNIATNAYDRTMQAANGIQYNPTNISGPLGGVTGSVGPNGQMSYNINPNSSGTGLFGASQGLINSGNQYLQNPGDPMSIATQMYKQMSDLAAPGDTTATQNLFNTLQSNGRLGVQQNGELGDIGQLDLSQRMANEQRQMDAMNYGNTLAQQRSALGGNLVSSGVGNYLNTAGAMTNLLPQSLQASYGPMTAAADRGQLAASAANTLGNNQINELAGTMQGAQGLLGQGGILSQLGGKLGTSLAGLLGGGTSAGDALQSILNNGPDAATTAATGLGGLASVPGGVDLAGAAGVPALPGSVFGGADAAGAGAGVAAPGAVAPTIGADGAFGGLGADAAGAGAAGAGAGALTSIAPDLSGALDVPALDSGVFGGADAGAAGAGSATGGSLSGLLGGAGIFAGSYALMNALAKALPQQASDVLGYMPNGMDINVHDYASTDPVRRANYAAFVKQAQQVNAGKQATSSKATRANLV